MNGVGNVEARRHTRQAVKWLRPTDWLSNYALPYAVFIAFVTISCFLVGAAARPESSWFLTGFLNTVAMLILLVSFVSSYRPSIISPLALILAVLTLSMPARYFYLSVSDFPWGVKWFLLGRGGSDFVSGSFLMLLFSLAFALAYRAKLRGLDLSALAIFEKSKTSLILAVVAPFLALAFVCLVLYLTATGGGPADLLSFTPKRRAILEGEVRLSFGQFLEIAEWILPIGLLLVGISINREGVQRPFLLAVGLANVVFFAHFKFIAGVRGEVALAFVMVGIVLFLRLQRVPTLAVVVATTLVLPVFLIITTARYEHNPNFISLTREGPFVVLLDGSVGAFNLGGFVASARTIETIPERLEYQLGKTLVEPAWVLVPRTLWPDKPRTTGMKLLSAFQGHQVLVTRKGGGNSTGLPAEGYLNFGWPGVIVIGLGFGLLLKSFWVTFAQSRFTDGAATAIYSYLSLVIAYDIFGYNFAKGAVEVIMKGACIFGIWLCLVLLFNIRRG